MLTFFHDMLGNTQGQMAFNHDVAVNG